MVFWNAPPGTNKIVYIGLKAGFEKCIGLGDRKKISAPKILALAFANKRDFVLFPTHRLAREITAFTHQPASHSECPGQKVPVTVCRIPKEHELRFLP